MRRVLYRVGQFLRYWRSGGLAPAERAQVRAVLPPPLVELFEQMAPGEQAHSLRVMQALRAQGHTRPEVLQAALLHDVGKIRAPLRLHERAEVVLAGRLLPAATARWGQAEPRGWRRPFVTAAQHADWGAELVARAGAPPLTVELVRRHQSPPPAGGTALAEWLRALQRADDEA